MNPVVRSAINGGGLALVGTSIVLGLAGPAQAAPGHAPAAAPPTTQAPASTVIPTPSATTTTGPAVAPQPSPTSTTIVVPAGNGGTAHRSGGTPTWEIAGLLGAGLTLLGGGVVAARRR